MGYLSRRRQFRIAPLHLESFERRDLLTAVHPLLSHAFTAPLSEALHAVHAHAEIHSALAVVHPAHAHRLVTAETSLLDSSTDATLDPNPGTDQQSASSDPSGADQASTNSTGTFDTSASSTVTPDGSPTATVASNDTTSNSPLDTTATADVSTDSTSSTTASQVAAVSVDDTIAATTGVDLSIAPSSNSGSDGQSPPSDTGGTDQGNSGSVGSIVDAGNTATDPSQTVAQTTTVSASDSGSSSGTVIDTTATSGVSHEDGSKATVSAADSRAVQASVNPQMQTQGMVEMYAGAGKDGQPTSGGSTAMSGDATGVETKHMTAGAVDPLSSVHSETANVRAGSSANVSPVMSHPANTGEPANRPSTAVHSTMGDVPHTAAQDLVVPSGQDSSRNRADTGLDPGRATLVAPSVVSSVPAAENVPGSVGYPGGVSGPQNRLDEAFAAWDLRSSLAMAARLTSESSATNAFGEAQQLGGEKPLAQDPESVDGAEDGLVGVSTRGEGLIGGSLPIDLAALAQEAENFLARAGQQVSQDLAGLLARIDPLSTAIAIGVAAMAIAMAHRRLQQGQRGLALEGWAGRTFGCYPGLGGTWGWAES